jgi:hypothetical protein
MSYEEKFVPTADEKFVDTETEKWRLGVGAGRMGWNRPSPVRCKKTHENI